MSAHHYIGGKTRKLRHDKPFTSGHPVLVCDCKREYPVPGIGPETTAIIQPCTCGALIRWNIGNGWSVEKVVSDD